MTKMTKEVFEYHGTKVKKRQAKETVCSHPYMCYLASGMSTSRQAPMQRFGINSHTNQHHVAVKLLVKM